MPKVIEEFEFKTSTRGFGEAKYDWDTLLDGTIYQCTKGEDFDCEMNTFTMMLRDRSKKRGKLCKISVDGENVTFQATHMSEEQLEKYKENSAKRKELRAAKKALKGVDPTEPSPEEDDAAGVEGEGHTHEDVTPEPEPVPEPPKPVVQPPKKTGGKKK